MSISISGTGGVANSAMELVGKASWTSNTSSVTFNFDSTKYEQYLIYWWIDHNPSWNVTSARFRTAGADITSTDYAFGTEWHGTSSAAGTTGALFNSGTGLASPNDAGGSSGKTLIWMAGNGNTFDSHGWGQIVVPTASGFYPVMRVQSTLIERTGSITYNERGWGTNYGVTSNNITGITIRGGDGGSSRRGMVSLVGIKKNPQN